MLKQVIQRDVQALPCVARTRLVCAVVNSNVKNKIKLSENYANAMNLLESSIVVDPNQINAYVQLAGLRGMLNKNEEALKYVRQGLETIKQIKEKNIPFHKSSIPGIQGGAQHLDDTERILLAMENDFS